MATTSSPYESIPVGVGEFIVPPVKSRTERALIIGRGVSVYYDLQPAYRSTEHQHDQVQIVISLDPVDGVASWVDQGVQHRYGVAGEFVWLVPANVLHAFDWQGTAGMVVLYVFPGFVNEVCGRNFTAGAIEDFSTLSRFDLLVCRLAAEFRSLCRHQASATAPLVESMGTLLAANILRYYARMDEDAAPGLPQPLLREVLDYIDANLRESIPREVLARISRLGVHSFARQFKIRTGMTPRDYIRRRRTVRALELIAEGKLKKAAIAGEVGFYDQSHMKRQLLRLQAEEAAIARASLPASGSPSP